MHNGLLHRYFAGVLRLRHFLQLQESLEQDWKKLPVPRRFLRWLLPVSFGAAVLHLLLPLLREKKEQRKRENRYPFV